jgi:HD-like signal output (HDOD) protein
MLTTNFIALTISDLLSGDIQLASPPNLYFALKAIIDNPHKSAMDAAFVIEKDAGLTAKLLKIVNSSFYGFPAQITSVEKAINLIGTRELQNLVLSTIVIERFSDLPGQTFSMHDFWARNLRCALLSRQLDQELGNRYKEVNFICGLLHNIGQLLFYRRIPVLARDVDLLLLSKQPVNYLDQVLIEQQVIGFDQFQAGAELCSLWNLPEVIIETIRLHAIPDNTSSYAELATIIRVANLFSSIENPYDDDIANSLNMSISQLSICIDKVHEEFEAIFKLFYTG